MAETYIPFDMHDGNLHPVTGIPEETIKMLYSALIGTEKILSYYSLMNPVTDSCYALIDWKRNYSIWEGNLLIRDLHKADNMTRTFLFEFRTVLDHMETKIKRQFGEQSIEWQIFKKIPAMLMILFLNMHLHII